MELKKNPAFDLERITPLFFSIGLVVALLFTALAFEWKSEYEPIEIKPRTEVFDLMYVPEITEQKMTEPPKPIEREIKKAISNKPPVFVEVEDEKELTKVVVEPTVEIADIPLEVLGEVKEEAPDFYEGKVESMPEFPGGMSAFYEYVGKNMKYPSQAKRMNVTGRVYVQFIINTDGSITDVKVIRGIGAGCDEAAQLVLENSPKFIPAKQRGVPVRFRQVMPIVFMLN